VQNHVQEIALADFPVLAKEMPTQEALEGGALSKLSGAFPEMVRTIQVSLFSLFSSLFPLVSLSGFCNIGKKKNRFLVLHMSYVEEPMSKEREEFFRFKSFLKALFLLE